MTPGGQELATMPTPEGSTTQVRFGGADLRDYYINIVPTDGGDSLKNGEPLKSPSILYRGRSDVAGLAVLPSAFNPRSRGYCGATTRRCPDHANSARSLP